MLSAPSSAAPASPRQVIIARAPTRLDFGGGWTDVPPYSDDEGGMVCNLAIQLHAVVRARGGLADDRPRFEAERGADTALAAAAARRLGARRIALTLESRFPIGAGLGGSSAAGVATAGALLAVNGDLAHESLDRSALAERSREIEVEELGVAGGRQDHYAAAYGGALALEFERAGTRVRRLALTDETRRAIERQCIVIYTGESRISGDTITAVLDAYRAREPRVVQALARMKALAASMANALEDGKLDELGRLVGEHWVHQRSLHPGIPTPRIDEIIATAEHAGATGSKALGASGGGCVMVIAPDELAERVRESIAPLGTPLTVAVDEDGFTWTTEVDDGDGT